MSNMNTPSKNRATTNFTTPPRNGKAKRVISPSAEQPSNSQRARISLIDDATHLREGLWQTFDDKQREELETLLKDTSIQLLFAITGRSIEDSTGTNQTLSTLQWPIMLACSELKVEFEDPLKLISYPNSNPYLVGTPKTMNIDAWNLPKDGRIHLKEMGINVWCTPAYAGKMNSNLTLNQLEYTNPNKLEPGEVMTLMQDLGATDMVICVHAKRLQEHTGWTTAGACNIASQRTEYAFRIMFPNQAETDLVYHNGQELLETGNIEERRGNRAERTAQLKLVMNVAWDHSNRSQKRITKEDSNERQLRSVKLTGVTCDNSSSRVRAKLTDLGFEDFELEMKIDHAIIIMPDEATAAEMIEQYGRGGTDTIRNGHQIWRPQSIHSKLNQLTCFNCGQAGHFATNCTNKSGKSKESNGWTMVTNNRRRSTGTIQTEVITQQDIAAQVSRMIKEQVATQIAAVEDRMNTRLEVQAKNIAKHSSAIEELDQKLETNAELLRNDIKTMIQGNSEKHDKSLEELKRMIMMINMSDKTKK